MDDLWRLQSRPPEVNQCKRLLAEAEREVDFCRHMCDYPSYCCTVERCGTVDIERWQKREDWCAEWGVTTMPILWPKPNTGKVAPECDRKHEEEE